MNIGEMLRRIVGAFAFSNSNYKEIEHNKTLGREAMLVVGIASVLSGVGLMIFNSAELGETAQMPLVRLALGVFGALFIYLLWSGIVAYMGSSYFGAETNVREMRRVLGYGYAPVALGVLSGLGGVGLLPWFLGYVWAMLTGIVGAKQALDVTWSRTIGTVAVAMVIGVLFFSFIAFMIGFPMYAFVWGW